MDAGNVFIIPLASQADDYAEFGPAPETAPAPEPEREVLGEILASLGSPAETGIWANAPFADETFEGILRDPATGRSVAAVIRPRSGPGQMSIEAYRALGIDAREVARIIVERKG